MYQTIELQKRIIEFFKSVFERMKGIILKSNEGEVDEH